MSSTGDASSSEPHDESAGGVPASPAAGGGVPLTGTSREPAAGGAKSASATPDEPVLDVSEESARAVLGLVAGGGRDELAGAEREEPVDDSPGARQRVLLDESAVSLRADARALALRMRALQELNQLAEDPAEPGSRRFLELEVAGSFHIGQLTASRWLCEANRYATALPLTLSLLESGELLAHQASAVLHATANVSPAIARHVEAEVLPEAAGLCPSDLKQRLVRAVLRIESETDPDAVEDRHAAAAADRHVWSRPEPDGMAQAGAMLTAEQARTWTLGMDTLERAERISDREAGVERTADQRRADLFAALPAMLLHARADLAAAGLVPLALSSREIQARLVLNIHVPVATVLDLCQEPGRLDGYGPISAQHLRLVRPVAFRRVTVDEKSGRPLHVDDLIPAEADPERFREQVRDLLPTELEEIVDRAEPQHDPSARLARLVDLRDVRCAGPGCGGTRAHRDHLKPWPAGPTAAWNLGLLTGRCHAAKHDGWTLVRHLDGSVTWTSPLGRSYDRPSPHPPPPQVDPYADSPPIRPAPEPKRPWWGHDGPLTPPETAEPDTSSVEPDDEPPPF